MLYVNDIVWNMKYCMCRIKLEIYQLSDIFVGNMLKKNIDFILIYILIKNKEVVYIKQCVCGGVLIRIVYD